MPRYLVATSLASLLLALRLHLVVLEQAARFLHHFAHGAVALLVPAGTLVVITSATAHAFRSNIVASWFGGENTSARIVSISVRLRVRAEESASGSAAAYPCSCAGVRPLPMP